MLFRPRSAELFISLSLSLLVPCTHLAHGAVDVDGEVAGEVGAAHGEARLAAAEHARALAEGGVGVLVGHGAQAPARDHKPAEKEEDTGEEREWDETVRGGVRACGGALAMLSNQPVNHMMELSPIPEQPTPVLQPRAAPLCFTARG